MNEILTKAKNPDGKPYAGAPLNPAVEEGLLDPAVEERFLSPATEETPLDPTTEEGLLDPAANKVVLTSTEEGSLAEIADLAADPATHATTTHASAHMHHQHTHAGRSRHAGGHHLLQVEDLNVSFTMYDPEAKSFFRAKKKTTPVIRNLNISVHVGEIVAVVGASGSGKTLLADAIFGLFEPNATVAGRIWFDGEIQDGESLAQLRGNGISLVPQSVTHLDPLMKVGRQVRGFTGNAAEHEKKQNQLFGRYGLAEEVDELYPFELSGGMARRVLLSCALVDNPKLIVADEPTPGLDLDLAVAALEDFRSFADKGGGVLLITHDIELALQVADRVAVFQDGTVVEETAVANFASPETLRHPFSKELWHALPEHDFEVMQ